MTAGSNGGNGSPDQDDSKPVKVRDSRGRAFLNKVSEYLRRVFENNGDEEDSDSLKGNAKAIVVHTVVLVLILLSVSVIHWVLNHIVGEGVRFFDRIPIRYVTDFADLLAIGKYLWSVIKAFGRKK